MNSNDILIANTDDLRSEMDYLEKTLLKDTASTRIFMKNMM